MHCTSMERLINHDDIHTRLIEREEAYKSHITHLGSVFLESSRVTGDQ